MGRKPSGKLNAICGIKPMRHFVLTILLCLLCVTSLAQYGGAYVPKRGSDYVQKETEQIGYRAVQQRYGLTEYNYTFDVRNGVVSWKFFGSIGNGSGRFRCNRNIAGEIIAAECVGVAYWNFACMFLWDMVEKLGKFDSIMYKRAVEALETALKQLEKGKATSPGAYNRVNLTYTDIQKAEKGEAKMSLWDTLCFYSAAMAENALNVSDLYDYDF